MRVCVRVSTCTRPVRESGRRASEVPSDWDSEVISQHVRTWTPASDFQDGAHAL